MQQGPHQGQAVLSTGKSLDQASAAMILIHGRGATAQSILGLSQEFAHPEMVYLAPQAAANTWYPNSFLAPIDQNEPGISSGMAQIRGIVEEIEAAGIPAERIMLGGFSQGACLASEFVARHARRYGGLFVLSGGLIGPDGTPRDYNGNLEGTPVFLGCSDADFHIPKARVEESAAVLEKLGGSVDMRLYPGMGHTVNADEIEAVSGILAGLMENSAE